MTRRATFGALALMAFFACDRADERPAEKPAPNATDVAPRPEQKPGGIDFEPPPERLALPEIVLDMRLRGDPIGTYSDRELPDGVPLQAVGLNRCQTGWALQGFMRLEDELKSTPPLLISLPRIPEGDRVEYTAPNADGQTMVLDLSEASMSGVAGTVKIVDAASDEAVMEMEMDGEPVGIAMGPGLGAQGCFTTGYYRLRADGESARGPVSAVWDQKRLYYVGLRLTETRGIGVWLFVKPTHRQPQNVIRGDLSRVIDKPKTFPFRVVFETTTAGDDGLRVEELPAAAGELTAAFVKAHPQGPLRIELEGLRFPEWDGPMSGREVDVRVETLIVTDIEGSSVPVPTGPNFELGGD